MISLEQRYKQRLGIKAKLRGYQRQAVEVGIRNPAFALLMAPRLGKTRVAISVAGYRHLKKQVNKLIVICPSIAKSVWKDELEQTLNLPAVIDIVEGKAKERALIIKGLKEIPGKLVVLVINHEATWRLKKFLYKWMPDMVIMDESHKAKNSATRQSSSMAVLGKRAKYRAILTGTFSTTPMDVYGQFKFLDPNIFGEKIGDFRRRYVATYGYGGYKPKTFKNLDELNEKVNSVSFILNREQAGGFPAELYQTIKFPLTNPALRHYKEMERELVTMVKGQEVKASVIVTQALRLQQITGGFLPVSDPDNVDLKTNIPLGNDRIKALAGVLDEFSINYPLVIFAKFRYELQAILELLKKMKRSSSFIAGGILDQYRDKAKLDFQKGKVDTCVVQIRAGGIAIDLSRADDAIFYSTTQSYFDREQALSRIIARTGGKKSFIDLVAEGTVDEDILYSAVEKKSLAEIISKKILG